MGALRQPLAAAKVASVTSGNRPSPAGDWEERCRARNYLAQPLGTQTLLYRATGGHATAMAIATKVLELTHAEIKIRGARPEWTKPIATRDLADELQVDIRTVQLALNVLCSDDGSSVLARRKAAGGANSYQAQPWLWEALAEAADGYKANQPAPKVEDSSVKADKPTFITDEPVVVFAGKRRGSLRLSDAVRSAMATVRTVRFEAGGANLAFTSRIDGSELLLSGTLWTPADEANLRRTQTRDASFPAALPAENKALPKSIPAQSAGSGIHGHQPPKTNLTSFSPAQQTLKTLIDERLAAAIGEGIDRAKLAETSAALGESPQALRLFETSIERKHRKIVANGNYSLLPRLAESAREAAATLPAPPQGVPGNGEGVEQLDALLGQKVGNSVIDYRKITGQPEATFEDWMSAERALRDEWEAGRGSRPGE